MQKVQKHVLISYGTLEEIKHQHREVARLATLGLSPKKISEQLGIDITATKSLLANPLVKAHSEMLAADRDIKTINIKNAIDDLLPVAVGVLHDTLIDTNLDLMDRSRRALDVLAVGGYVPPKNVNIRQVSVQAVITEAKKRAAELMEYKPINELQLA